MTNWSCPVLFLPELKREKMEIYKVWNELVLRNYEGRRVNYGQLMPNKLADHLAGATRYIFFIKKIKKKILGPMLTLDALIWFTPKPIKHRGFMA